MTLLWIENLDLNLNVNVIEKRFLKNPKFKNVKWVQNALKNFILRLICNF